MPKNKINDLEKYRKTIGQYKSHGSRKLTKPSRGLFNISNYEIAPYNLQRYDNNNLNTGLGYIAGLALHNIAQHKDIGKNLGLFTLCCSILSPSLLHSVMAEEVKNFNSHNTSINATSMSNEILLGHSSKNILSDMNQAVFTEQSSSSSLSTKQIKTNKEASANVETLKQKNLDPEENNVAFHYDPKKIIVEIAPTLTEKGKRLEKKLTELADFIKQQIPQLPIHPKVLNRVQDLGVIIFITPMADMVKISGSPSAYGYTVPTNNLILIKFEEKYSKEQIKATLLNELHHMAVIATNRKNLKDNIVEQLRGKIALPFLNKDGIINKTQFDQLKLASEEFLENIRKLTNDVLSNQNITKEIRNAITKHYKPFVYTEEISYEQYVYDYKEGTLKPGDLLFGQGNQLNLKLEVVDILQHDMHGIRIREPGNQGALIKYAAKPDTEENILAAFVYDMIHVKELASSDSIERKGYNNISEEKRLAELSSHIEMLLPNEIKQILCPKWCKYFSRFHNVKNHCSFSPQPEF